MGDTNRLSGLSQMMWNAHEYRIRAWEESRPFVDAPNIPAVHQVDSMIRASTGMFMTKDEYHTAVSILQRARNFRG